MRGARVFADVLDEKMREEQLASASAARPYRCPPTLGYFLFTPGTVPASVHRAAWPGPRIRIEAPDVSSRPAPDRGIQPSRARRRLNAAQQAAFDALLDLGAAIGPDFTPAELRSAFRDLARRFHPDRHPGIPADERVRLTRLFVRAREACRILRGL
jgi:hypothetical protein